MKHLLALRSLAFRSFSTAVRNQFKNKVLEYQRIFQADNDLPVHLKGGTVDTVLYHITMVITVRGAFFSICHLFQAALPRKKK
ncbi:cytochrome c oxidase subunit 7A2, mitochondrial-like [Hemiscyllium ocellatum]|uniref:cytochrome c oxidase subunit 7A2, mitochondrial-like n=1 Tax=Hemiscyllium ocellatum TaxID=170820 RepID=UPI0029676A9A|nr:cytochrome c oxidase subunit 7A2, mitochondrial-like [Hemiscyllium ocellatum]